MKRQQAERKKNVILNMFYITVCQLLTALLSFFNRKVLLKVVGMELLGVNSLFSDIFMLFSFADLGIGVAITFMLYQPIANGDTKRIQSILLFYKKIYRYVIGLLIIISVLYYPFLKYLKTDIPMNNLVIYYILFQLNNIIGYMFAYRETYIIACQRERVVSVISFLVTVLRTIVQMIVLGIYGDYLIYLLIATFAAIVQKVAINWYVIKKYPETKLIDAEALPKEDVRNICKKAFAMLIHRLGNLAINQTDSLVVSYMVSVAKWGVVSNYLLIKTAISTIMAKVYSAILPTMGDVIAKESKAKQLQIFYMYDMFNFWIYGFCFVSLKVLSTPFVSLYFGPGHIIDEFTVFMLCFAFFIDGLRSPVSAVREAGGIYDKDKWYTILAGVVNLVFSILLVKMIDLPGVYVGTIMAMLVLIISRTVILFREYFDMSPCAYLFGLFTKTIAALGGWLITQWVCDFILKQYGHTILCFCIIFICVCIIPNLFWLLIFVNNEYLRMIFSILKRKDKKND